MDRRSFLVTSSAALAGCYVARGSSLVAPAPRRPVPTASQLAWQRDEMAMFIHFGMNTFTDREVGDGTESPALFNPTAFDARQWAATARDADFRAMVLTAKHHDGFCLWPTATTQHSVASSPWRGGQGDVVQEFVDACRGDNLKVGLYLSPWDRNSPLYGDSPRYNDLYAAQLTELLTRYGKIDEVWFDGANGEGPNGKRQVYDWARVFAIVRQLQPEAVIFSDAGPDIRWCGNERGVAGDPNWSTIKPESVPFPGADGSDVINALQHGHPLGTVWRPAEVDVSIRPGWFYHPAEDGRVRSVDNLLDLYLSSVGRNGKLLLNVPPTPAGLLHENDVKVLKDFTFRQNKRFDTDMANGLQRVWQVTGPRSADVIINLGGPVTPSIVRLGENIERGQTVVRHSLYGLVGTQKRWTLLSHGTTIGYAKMARLFGAPLQEFRVSIEDCLSAPEPITVTLYE
jgi:alpha-L-fucosidase